MQLVITEKPSVAKTIAETIGAKRRQKGYFEGNGYVVSWCLGHLVELAMPTEYNSRYEKWTRDHLPIIPRTWCYHIKERSREQFRVLKMLMERPDVESLICATDAGREGELIFRLVYEQAGCRKTFRRLWISSLEEQAVREGFRNLKPSEVYDPLYEAAICRERADWLVGINATRLFSCLYCQTMNVGRVMTPTLEMVVKREQEIAVFEPEAFYTVELNLGGFTAVSEHLKTSWEAKELISNALGDGTALIIDVTVSDREELPPHLFDLTSLQREANRRYGFTAQQTLDYAQSLYEKKLLTYPRTDSCYLSEDKKDLLPALVKRLYEELPGEKPGVIHTERVLNSEKVTDHEALLPTGRMTKDILQALPEGEEKLIRLIVMRVIEAVSEPHLYRDTKVSLFCGGKEFSAAGREELRQGWRAYESENKKVDTLPDGLRPGQRISVENASVREGAKRPPSRYTEGSLLRAMETAGKEEMPKEAVRRGLGTTATRAGIIEKLIHGNFIERKRSEKSFVLVPTEKGTFLIGAVPEILKTPSLTAEWEEKLLRIERGEMMPEQFMSEIADLTEQIVNVTELHPASARSRADIGCVDVGTCPACGGKVIERLQGYFCINSTCQFAIWKNNRFFESIGKTVTKSMVTDLLRRGCTFLHGCHSKTGRKFNAMLRMTCEENGKPAFSLDFEHRRKKS